jgi:3',5'-cyclic AMP phosphodiesterase CpdA
LLSKRGLGWASWQAQRRRRYRPEVLDALLADLHAQAPDQIAITGDLTQVALEEEFREAASWLTRVGPPERVSAIPGNHDATVRVSEARGLGHWSGYLESDVHAERFRSDPGYLNAAMRSENISMRPEGVPRRCCSGSAR